MKLQWLPHLYLVEDVTGFITFTRETRQKNKMLDMQSWVQHIFKSLCLAGRGPRSVWTLTTLPCDGDPKASGGKLWTFTCPRQEMLLLTMTGTRHTFQTSGEMRSALQEQGLLRGAGVHSTASHEPQRESRASPWGGGWAQGQTG